MRRWRFTEAEVRAVVSESVSYSEALRRLGIRAAGGNHKTLRTYVQRWGISTDHFDPYSHQRHGRRMRRPLSEILVQGSNYSRNHLKERLFEEGVKQRCCEICGQGESWLGRQMALVLDHANGVHDDHRLENLRVLCPNCNATLDTHCGRHNRRKHRPRGCATCGATFQPTYGGQRYCGHRCAGRGEANRAAQVAQRRVERPPHDRLLREIAETSYVAVARKYGVSDNAIRKWVRAYEREREEGERLSSAA